MNKQTLLSGMIHFKTFASLLLLLQLISCCLGLNVKYFPFASTKRPSTLSRSSKRFTVGGNALSCPPQTTQYKIFQQDHPLSPPRRLSNLPLHTTMNPIKSLPHIKIKRIATNPDAFLLSNFLSLPEEQVSLIMGAVRQGMEYAGTTSGDVVKQRKNSYISWISPCEEEIHNDDKEISGDHQSRKIARYMTELSSFLFVPDHFKDEKITEWTYNAEPVQTVRYGSGGKYDVHHDGYNRFITVLTYLNGVAGTWFPYAIIDPNEHELEELGLEDESIPDMTMDTVATDKVPGRDGILIVGVEGANDYENHDAHVVKVQPGDAIVFYSYDWIETDKGIDQREKGDCDSKDLPPPTGPFMNWRSIHSGQETDREKWIATNWFRVVGTKEV